MKDGLCTSSRGKRYRLLIAVWLVSLVVFGACGLRSGPCPEKAPLISDHFDGKFYYNPGSPTGQGEGPKRSIWGWVWLWLTREDWSEFKELPPGSKPPARVPKGTLRITSIGHATFLIQIDGLNILTDPIWSDRCSPFSWVGPKRHSRPGLLMGDLPPIDAVLVSHNHYDHLDLPTLEQLARKGTRRSLVPLGNGELVRSAGIPKVDELDWWQTLPLSADITVTLVPARHFSSRTLWDRNQTLWGGFIISGTRGNIFFAGDTGYGPHFQEIARRFSPIRVALLPIAPFQPKNSTYSSPGQSFRLHMGPREAVQAHLDLGAPVSLAAHFQVFQLGADGFNDAVAELGLTLKQGNLNPETFLALSPGQSHEWIGSLPETTHTVKRGTLGQDARKEIH